MPTDHSSRPPGLITNPLRIVARDLIHERRTRVPFPPGPRDFDLRRTLTMTRYPLPLLLELYHAHGPIFSFRALHRREVFMVGPEANQFITVSHPEHFHWREGHFGDLVPLLGDGLITTDAGYHDRARRIMMPAFHREQIEAAVDVIVEETARAMDAWRPGQRVDVYQWARVLALRIAMRALMGLDPDTDDEGVAAAHHFEGALAFYGITAFERVLRGPRTPWRRMLAARRELDGIVFAEIARRRREPRAGARDILTALIETQDDDGSGFSDGEIRDHLVSLMFAGHDTSTSTIAFLLYELARHPDVLARLWEEQDRVLGGRPPTAADLHSALPELEMTIDETLRLYPPVWVGARRAMEDFEFAGHTVPAGAFVNYSPWVSHRLPDVFEQPALFMPERFTPERKAALPRGAYVPFGAGSRICIGKRFAQTVVKTVSTMLLQRFRLDLPPGYGLRVALEPTLSPAGGLPVVVRERDMPEVARAVPSAA
jgi:cytochrome P450